MSDKEMEKHEKDMEEYNRKMEDRNWKLYEASEKYTDSLWQNHVREIDKMDKWLLTVSAGSFGLSFAFIDKIVPISTAHSLAFLVGAWACFLAVLAIGVTGILISAVRSLAAINEENKRLSLRYEGKEPEYKSNGAILDTNMVMGYAQILVFIGGSVCLILLFIVKNLL